LSFGAGSSDGFSSQIASNSGFSSTAVDGPLRERCTKARAGLSRCTRQTGMASLLSDEALAQMELNERSACELLIVSNGMDAGKLSALIDSLKEQSKNAGGHKLRQLLWEGYGAIAAKLGGLDGSYAGFLKWGADGASLTPTTKKQAHALGQGSLEILGRRHRPLEEPEAKSWIVVFTEQDATEALHDITAAEACISITDKACHVGTRYKRRRCKGVSSALKTPKDVEKFLSELGPSLLSVEWTGSTQMEATPYNVLLAGAFATPLVAALPDGVGHISSHSSGDIYDAFLSRRSSHFVGEAERLLDGMEADMGKKKLPCVVATIKEASCCRKNSLLKRVFVHASKIKFIESVRNDGGDVDLHVIEGDIKGSRFADFGGIVAEMFYAADLTVY